MLTKILFFLRHAAEIWAIAQGALKLAKKFESETGTDSKTAETVALEATKKSVTTNATAEEIAQRDAWMHNRPDGGG